MSFIYTQSFVDSGLTYAEYKQHMAETLAAPPADENAAKLLPRVQENLYFMNLYDQIYTLSESLKTAVNESPASTWVVISEGWCTDAAFNLPIIAAVADALPEKVILRIFLRDSNLDLIDANLTDGGRSIPKLIILDNELQEMAKWGPRPAALHARVKAWREEGMSMGLVIPKMQVWYDTDSASSFQQEMEMVLGAVAEVHGIMQD
jgi:hypothetical protein